MSRLMYWVLFGVWGLSSVAGIFGVLELSEALNQNSGMIYVSSCLLAKLVLPIGMGSLFGIMAFSGFISAGKKQGGE